MGEPTPIEALFPEQALDRDYYLRTHVDVARAGVDPWDHFRRWGHKEGRLWSEAARPLEDVLRRGPEVLRGLLEALPDEKRAELLGDASAWSTFRSMVHPEFYVAQVHGIGSDGEELGSGADSERVTVDDVIEHYLRTGAELGLRPSALFHPGWYREAAARRWGTEPRGNTFFHWLQFGRSERISPTPLFDESFYTARHADMARLSSWPFEHFASHGAYEAFRRSTAAVRELVADPTARAEQRPLVLDLMLRGADAGSLRTSTPIEDLALMSVRKRARLDHPALREMAEKAYRIEPLVRRPYGPRDISMPPVVNHASGLFRAAEEVRTTLGLTEVDTIVLVPHVRMAGSARVAGMLARSLREIAPEETILVLTTEADTFEHPEWFGGDVLVGDVSAAMRGLPDEARTRLLLDVVRGLQPRRVVNVNSRRAWELFRLFGRQLSVLAELHAYLFTWDLDDRGNKGGYPIAYLPECLGNLDSVLVDSEPLREELVARYGHSSAMARRFIVVHTPYEPEGASIDHSAVFARRRARGVRPRFLWCGRFDRQKRFDVVVDLATRRPDIEFWVWGKSVLGGVGVDMDALPENVRLQGTYQDFDDLPFESADGFLYTAEWDGVPTVLIDAGVRGIAVVASAVGGVVDLVDHTTGFPVAEFADASAYDKAITAMTGDPQDVGARAAALRRRVLEICSPERYRDTLRGVLPSSASDQSVRDLEGMSER
ncbi:glycosyltransferase [Isoptericola sp. NPDC057391]|uniref:glycosyltransferase n=1 Tax=Isoptericola sp. NPDC057391 TaxID=3346117 RepID=UPI003633FC16